VSDRVPVETAIARERNEEGGWVVVQHGPGRAGKFIGTLPDERPQTQ
jgi:hypothetical protein